MATKNNVDVSLDQIDLTQDREVAENHLKGLEESIHKNGLVNPIKVKREKNGRYKIIDGRVRVKVFHRLGKKKIKADILDTKSKDDTYE